MIITHQEPKLQVLAWRAELIRSGCSRILPPPFLTITSLKPHCYFRFLTLKKNFQNGDQQKTSNTDDERVSKFQLQRPSNKKNFVTTSVTLRKLLPSLSETTH